MAVAAKHYARLTALVAVSLLGLLTAQSARAGSGTCRAEIVKFANVDSRQNPDGPVYEFTMVIDVTADAQHPDVWAKADMFGPAGNFPELNADDLHVGRNVYTRWIGPRVGYTPGKYETLWFHLECDSDGSVVAGNIDAINVVATARARVYKPGEPHAAPVKPSGSNKAAACPEFVVIDSRGSGSSGISPPGSKFTAALRATVGSRNVRLVPNRYKAVSVMAPLKELLELLSPNPLSIRSQMRIISEALNGLGALARNKKVGAYRASVADGEKKLRAAIAKVPASCKAATRLILVGYSQGAQVTGDVYQSLEPALKARVASVVLFGDPRFNPRDSSDRFGLNDPKPSERWTNNQGVLGQRKPFNDPKVRSFCHRGDPVCQGIGQWLHARAHTNYPEFGEPTEAAREIANG